MNTTPASADPAGSSFADLGVSPEICAALERRGITSPFAIQELTLPIALDGRDIIGQARTGMGKTYGFGVPLLNRIASGEVKKLDGTPRALVVVPTRELCMQVTSDLRIAAEDLQVPKTPRSRTSKRPLVVEAIYGGTSYDGQKDALASGVDVVVGTPGRLLDLANQKVLNLSAAEILVLDEADQMLDLGFLPDVESILRLVPERRQTMLFSATMPQEILTLSRRFLSKPMHVRAESASSTPTHEVVRQFVYRAHNLDKVEMISRILQAEGRGATMIFTRTKRSAHNVSEDLKERGFKATAIHGDLGQQARERALDRFRTGKADVIVATDVAARGIDIDDVTHVINYQCPDDEKTYIHRIGRTGRAGRDGIAITLVDWDDLFKWNHINKALELGKPEPAETYSSSPHLYSDLDIPEGITGRVAPPSTEKANDGGRGDSPRGRSSRGGGNRRRRSGSVSGSAPASEQGASADSGGESSGRRRRRRTRGNARPSGDSSNP